MDLRYVTMSQFIQSEEHIEEIPVHEYRDVSFGFEMTLDVGMIRY